MNDHDTLGRDFSSKARHIIPGLGWGTASSLLILVIINVVSLNVWPQLGMGGDFWAFWLPFMVPALPLMLCLEPKLAILKFRKGDGQPDTLVLVIAIIGLGTASACLHTALPRLLTPVTSVMSIAEIDPDNPAPYYEIEAISVDMQQGGSVDDSRLISPETDNFIYYQYYAVPILAPGESYDGEQRIWFGKRVSKLVQATTSDAERAEINESLYQHGLQELNRLDLNTVGPLRVVKDPQDRFSYGIAIAARAYQAVADRAIILAESNDRLMRWEGNAVLWFLTALALLRCSC
ncbi:MAG: hypothetical protein AAGJ86_04870 [Pseudomonadota bacterium]